MKNLADRLRFLSGKLQKHSLLWDVMQDVPERNEDHFDTNVIHKPDRYFVQKIWEGRPVEEEKQPVVKDLHNLKEEPGVEIEELEGTPNNLEVIVLK